MDSLSSISSADGGYDRFSRGHLAFAGAGAAIAAALAAGPDARASATDIFPSAWVEDVEDLTLVGQGGYGRVYLGREKASGAPIALKWIELEDGDEMDVVRNEIQVMRELGSVSGFVQLLEARVEGPAPNERSVPGQRRYALLKMEAATGGDLSTLIRLREGSMKDRARFATEIAEALAVMHQKGLVHRDVKPANVVLSKPVEAGAHAKLADLGLACASRKGPGDVYLRVTACGSDGGTWSYTPPEIWQRRFSVAGIQGRPRDTEAWTSEGDVWSFGMLVYELAVGHMPEALRNAPASRRPHEITRLNIENDPHFQALAGQPDLQELIRGCLRRSPSQRLTAEEALGRAQSWLAAIAARRRLVASPPDASPGRSASASGKAQDVD